MESHLEKILDALRSPETCFEAEKLQLNPDLVFKIANDTPTYRGRKLDPATLAELVYSGESSAEETFRRLCIGCGKTEVRFLSGARTPHSTMQFTFDDSQRMYYLNIADVASVFPPSLRTTLLIVLQYMLNFYETAETSGFIDGLRDTCDNPMVWRAAVRKNLYALSAEAIGQIEPHVEASTIFEQLEKELRKSSQKL